MTRRDEDRSFQNSEVLTGFASGTAHIFNNILAVIRGHAQIMKSKNHMHVDDQDSLDIIIESCDRASEHVEKLMGFARKGKYQPQPTNINALLSDSLAAFENIKEEEIELDYHLDQVHSVQADQTQLKLAFKQLLLNAREAMPDGGKLHIRTKNYELWRESAQRYGLETKGGKFVKMEIKDTGPGMEQKVLENIFHPFYSTKIQSSGLGLSAVQGILANHKGFISVESECGEGSAFYIYLPIKNGHSSHQTITESISPSEKRSILVVDDDEPIRLLITEHLKILGYHPISAADGMEAIEIYQKRRDIDLVLMDMIMPKRDGRETFEILKEMDPEVKVVIMSGFCEERIIIELLQAGVQDFLRKPFRFEELSDTVHALVNESAPYLAQDAS